LRCRRAEARCTATASSARSRVAVRGQCALFGLRTQARAATAAGKAQTGAAATPSAAAGRAGDCRMTAEAKSRAFQEIAFCESVLAKAGLNVLSETFRDTGEITAWDHYPQGDVFDPVTGAQWFYHCHPAEEGGAEHGHFHCFLRPDGVDGPIHHLAAVGVDAYGKILRLFTVNQWVVGDNWLDAEATIALVARFDVQMPRPSYLVNRWLTAVFAAYEDEIVDLIRLRDQAINAFPAKADVPVREDRSLEVASELSMTSVASHPL
jgi:hypothetical protein